LVFLLSAAAAAAPEAVLEINDTGTSADDYLCWTPVHARVRLVTETGGAVPVTISQKSSPGGGRVSFFADNGKPPTPANFNPQETIELTLPGDGSWRSFWVGGRVPSIARPDVTIVTMADDGSEIGSATVMVRVRKNAEALTSEERDRFLSALRALHDLDHDAAATEYLKYAQAHDDAFQLGIHGGNQGFPLFLSWHRAFLLSLERELQKIDPTVTLPYWRYDRQSTKIFTPDFMGTVSGNEQGNGGYLVEFSPTNPLRGWTMPDDEGPLVRGRDGDREPPVPANRLDLLFAQPWAAGYGGVNGGINGGLEYLYHNGAHSIINGWLNTGASPRDPLFYLLHANADHAWALWQQERGAFDFSAQDGKSYSAPGSYPGPQHYRKGSYADDIMWPWSNVGGDGGNTDPGDDWPTIAFPMPPGFANSGPNLPPTPASQIDYLDTHGRGLALNACYDDIPFKGASANP
jgi:tyrosinase